MMQTLALFQSLLHCPFLLRTQLFLNSLSKPLIPPRQIPAAAPPVCVCLCVCALACVLEMTQINLLSRNISIESDNLHLKQSTARYEASVYSFCVLGHHAWLARPEWPKENFHLPSRPASRK